MSKYSIGEFIESISNMSSEEVDRKVGRRVERLKRVQKKWPIWEEEERVRKVLARTVLYHP